MLGAGGEVDGAVAQQRAQERRTEERQVAGAAGIAAEFGILAPSHVAAIVIGAFDAPVAAAAGQPLPASQSGAFERGDEHAHLTAGGAGFLVGHRARHRDDGGGMGEAQLLWGGGGECQLAVFGPAVVTVVGEKRGRQPASA